MKHVLAAIDFSPHTEQIVAASAELCAALKARLTLLHVAAPDPDFIGYSVGPQNVRDSRAAELSREHAVIHQTALTLQSQGIDCHGLLVSGSTSDTILQEARRFQCDMIVIGTHGRGAIYQTLMGSVVSDVIRRTSCPVVVVPSKPSL